MAPPLTNSGPWCGALSDTSVMIRASVKNEVTAASVTVSESANFGVNPRTYGATDFWTTGTYPGKIVTFEPNELQPDTRYFFRLRLNERDEEALTGRFRTAPQLGHAASFKFACSGCARGSLSHIFRGAYQALGAMQDLLFFCYLGDFYYGGSKGQVIEKRLKAYDEALGGHPGDLFRNLPIAYCWDDHDFLGNASAGGAPENASPRPPNNTPPLRTVARDAYDKFVPHYPIASQTDGIYQSFQIGRVLFLLTDTRYFRSRQSDSDNAQKSMLGDSQKLWLKNELSRGKQLDLIVWMNSVPWIAEKEVGQDHWGGYTEERAELATFIVQEDIRNICMLGADAHMVAIDSGEHSGFAPNGRGGFPVFQAASLHSFPVTPKGGGRYTVGNINGGAGPGMQGRGQFGVCEILYENGDPIVRWTPYRTKGTLFGSSELKQLPGWRFRARRTFDGF